MARDNRSGIFRRRSSSCHVLSVILPTWQKTGHFRTGNQNLRPTFADGHEKMAIEESGYYKPLRFEMILWKRSSTRCGITGFSFYNIWYENKSLT
jgi:hypothetical protein